jgi:hypothetical protein
MQSLRMWRRVVLVRTEVSEERTASIVRMTRIGELGTKLGVTSNRSELQRTNIKAICSSETSVLTIATQHHNSEDGILRSHDRKNLKSYIFVSCVTNQ